MQHIVPTEKTKTNSTMKMAGREIFHTGHVQTSLEAFTKIKKNPFQRKLQLY